jgi:hypothetical protein
VDSAPIFAEVQFPFFALIFLGGQAGFSTAAMARSPEPASLFQQPELENHWEPMRNQALPSVMAFVAQATGFRNAECGMRKKYELIPNSAFRIFFAVWVFNRFAPLRRLAIKNGVEQGHGTQSNRLGMKDLWPSASRSGSRLSQG